MFGCLSLFILGERAFHNGPVDTIRARNVWPEFKRLVCVVVAAGTFPYLANELFSMRMILDRLTGRNVWPESKRLACVLQLVRFPYLANELFTMGKFVDTAMERISAYISHLTRGPNPSTHAHFKWRQVSCLQSLHSNHQSSDVDHLTHGPDPSSRSSKQIAAH